MTHLNTRAMKAEFLAGIQTGKYSIRDLQKDQMIVVMDDETGGFICHETGERFTEQDRKQGLKNKTWIEL